MNLPNLHPAYEYDCESILKIQGPSQLLACFKANAIGFWPWDDLTSESTPPTEGFMPIPLGVPMEDYDTAHYDVELQAWDRDWGRCKSEIMEDCRMKVVCRFQGSWSLPMEYIQELSRKWPGLTFERSSGIIGMKHCPVVKIRDGKKLTPFRVLQVLKFRWHSFCVNIRFRFLSKWRR